MNPGVVALEQLVELGVFGKGQLPTPGSGVHYFPTNAPSSARNWKSISGLVFTAARWVGTRGLSIQTGRIGAEVQYIYREEEDRHAAPQQKP